MSMVGLGGLEPLSGTHISDITKFYTSCGKIPLVNTRDLRSLPPIPMAIAFVFSYFVNTVYFFNNWNQVERFARKG